MHGDRCQYPRSFSSASGPLARAFQPARSPCNDVRSAGLQPARVDRRLTKFRSAGFQPARMFATSRSSLDQYQRSFSSAPCCVSHLARFSAADRGPSSPPLDVVERGPGGEVQSQRDARLSPHTDRSAGFPARVFPASCDVRSSGLQPARFYTADRGPSPPPLHVVERGQGGEVQSQRDLVAGGHP